MSIFQTFLTHSIASKEVSLAIAKDEAEEQEFIVSLETNGFKKAVDANDFVHQVAKNKKLYLMARENLRKDLYDCIVQYPTGAIDLFNSVSMKSQVINPSYEDSSVVLVITKYHLSQVLKHGFDLLSHTGMAYQT